MAFVASQNLQHSSISSRPRNCSSSWFTFSPVFRMRYRSPLGQMSLECHSRLKKRNIRCTYKPIRSSSLIVLHLDPLFRCSFSVEIIRELFTQNVVGQMPECKCSSSWITFSPFFFCLGETWELLTQNDVWNAFVHDIRWYSFAYVWKALNHHGIVLPSWFILLCFCQNQVHLVPFEPETVTETEYIKSTRHKRCFLPREITKKKLCLKIYRVASTSDVISLGFRHHGLHLDPPAEDHYYGGPQQLGPNSVIINSKNS